MPSLSVALWAVNLTPRLNGIDAWIAGVDDKLREAKQAGADLLAMPEYACVQWLSFAPQGLKNTQEIPWMAGHTEAAVARLRALAARHAVALLAGSMPVKANGRWRNRAFLLLPEGGVHTQDKLCPTPHERDPGDWNIGGGDSFAILEWRGLRLAVAVCLDIELPALSAKLAGLGLDLVLVPSMTETLSGYHRVFDCAKARAVELHAAVAAFGTVGDTPYRAEPETNVAGATVYIPCEDALGVTGTLAHIPPRGNEAGPGPVLVVSELPIDKVRAGRAGGARVWPGAWSAEHVRVIDPRAER